MHEPPEYQHYNTDSAGDFFLSPSGTTQDNQFKFDFKPVKLRESELSSKEVLCMMQDSRGFIWIGTKSGLNLFDGYTYKIFKQNLKNEVSLGGNYILYLFEDVEGRIVVKTNNSTDIYNPRTGYFSHVGVGMGDEAVENRSFAVHALQGSDKSIYFVSDSELYVYEPARELAIQLNVLKKIGYNSRLHGEFISYAEDMSGTLWFPFQKKIAGYNPKKKESYYVDLSGDTTFHGNRIYHIYAHSINKIGLFTETGHYVYDTRTSQLSTEICYNLPVNGYDQLAILRQDKKNILWFTSTSESRLILFDPQSRTFTDYLITGENGQGMGQIRSLFLDQQNIWWLGTPNDGLFYSYSNNLNTFKQILSNTNRPNSINHTSVRAIIKSIDGTVWIGTDGGGINVYDPYSDKITQVYSHIEDDNTTVASNSILTIFQDSYGRILLGGYNTGLAVFNYARGQFKNYLPEPGNPNSLSHHDVRSIAEIGDGLYLIALNGGYGLELFDIYQDKISHFDFDPNIPGGDIVSHWLLEVYKDPEGAIWIGGYGGLGKFDPVTGKSENYFSNERDTTTLSNSWVQSILRDSKGTLWVGTSYGLNRFNERTKTFTHFFEEDGLPDNNISGILEDSDNKLWISTNKGIACLRQDSMKFSSYNASDGLKIDQYIPGARFKDENGIIYFGGIGGLVMFDPSDFKKNEYIPPVYLTDFQLSYKSVQPAQKGSPLKQHIAFTDRIKLSHRQNMITINYVALNYMSPRKNQYECMLEGQEKEWQKMGTRQEATYTNISPGKYIFHVRASNNDGVWNTEGTRVKIVITPPWWKRWWFRIFIIMLIGYAVYTLIKMRSDAIKHDKLILQRKIDEGEFELQKQRNEIEQHKRDLLEQEKVSSEINWYNEGMTTLGDIISKNSHNPGEMAGKLISGLVEYVEANIGVLYIINEEGTDDQRLEILGSYALDKSRLKKYFSGDEGYLGACYKEKKNIIIDNLPDNYAVVGSGWVR